MHATMEQAVQMRRELQHMKGDRVSFRAKTSELCLRFLPTIDIYCIYVSRNNVQQYKWNTMQSTNALGKAAQLQLHACHVPTCTIFQLNSPSLSRMVSWTS